MMKSAKKSDNNLLFLRSGLVVFAVINIIAAALIMKLTLLQELSYIIGPTMLIASAIMFGWACYLGIAQRQIQQVWPLFLLHSISSSSHHRCNHTRSHTKVRANFVNCDNYRDTYCKCCDTSSDSKISKPIIEGKCFCRITSM